MRQCLIDQIPAGIHQVIGQGSSMRQGEPECPQGTSLAIFRTFILYKGAVIIHKIAKIAVRCLGMIDKRDIRMNEIECHGIPGILVH
ncbi:hypothetical protein D3C76_1377080 [compost metagenome]